MAMHEFLNYQNWVVCGRVLDESKYAYTILQALRSNGYNAEGYHPNNDIGPGVYHDFQTLPFQPEVLDLVIRPALGLQVVAAAYEAGIRRVMAQPGARSEAIAAWCQEHGMEYVEGCVLVELERRRS